MKLFFYYFFFLFLVSGCLSSDSKSLKDLAGEVPAAPQTDAGGGSGGNTADELGLPLVIPQLGSTTVATNVTIRGVDFAAGVMDVEFGGVQCQNITVISTTQITCTVSPQAAGAVSVVVKKSGNTQFDLSSGFIFVPEPGTVFGLVSISPYIGSTAGGTTLTIIGSGFSGAVTATVDGAPCTSVNVISSSLLTCVTPPGTIGGKDVVINKGAETVTATGGFTYVGSPSLTTVLPVSGPATLGTNITLTGQDFVAGALVTISTSTGTYYCQNVNVAPSGQTLTCLIPAITAAVAQSIAGAANVTVVNPDGQSSALNGSFTYLLPPIFSSQSLTGGGGGILAPPADGVLSNGGVAIVWNINGVNFQAGVTTRINGVDAPNCVRLSTTLIRCQTSFPAVGVNTANYSLTIMNADGQFDNNSLTFAGRPNITGTTPGVVPTNNAATEITVLGDNVISHNGSNPTIKLFDSTNTTEQGTCTIVSNVLPSCTVPSLASSQNTVMRFTNSYGYRGDYSFLPFSFLAKIIVTLPVDIGDTGGFNKLGRIPLGEKYKIGYRLSNLSSVYSITGISFNTASLTNTDFSIDAVSTTCTATIAPSGSCDVFIEYDGDKLRAQDPPGNVIINYNNGAGPDVAVLSLGNVITIPLKTSAKAIDFGEVSYGNNHAGRKPRIVKVLQIHNRADRDLILNLGATNFDTGTQFRYAGGGAFPGAVSGAYPMSTACPASGILTPNLKCSVFIEYIPATSGIHADTLKLYYSGSKLKEVALSGESNAATITTCNPAGSPFGGGDGSVGTPYLLCSAAHITNLATNSAAGGAETTWRTYHYLITDDIDASGLANPKLNFSSAGASGGSINGGGYLINNFAISGAGFINANASTLSLSNLQFQNLSYASTAHTQSILVQAVSSVATNLFLDHISIMGASITTGHQTGGAIIGGVSNGLIEINKSQLLASGTSNQTSGIYTATISGGTINLNDSDVFGTDDYTLAQGLFAAISGGTVNITNLVHWRNTTGATHGISGTTSGGVISIDGCEINREIPGGGSLFYSIPISVSLSINKCGIYGNHKYGLIYSSVLTTLTIENTFSAAMLFDSNRGAPFVGGNGGAAQGGILRDVFFAGKNINAGNANASGMVSIHSGSVRDMTIQRAYVASALQETTIYGATSSTKLNSFSSNWDATNNCSFCYFMLGIGNDVSHNTSEIFGIDKPGMSSFMPGITNGAKWRTNHYDSVNNIGYPFPILDWMDDDFMP